MGQLNIRPNAAGGETNLPTQYPDSGSHYDKVKEEVADEDSTYVASPPYGETARDLYNLDNTDQTGTITSIDVVIRARSETLGALDRAVIAIKTGGTAYEYTGYTTTTDYQDFTKNLTTNPKTGLDWTWDDINALQAGCTLTGFSSNLTRCTQVYVVVNYVSGPPGVKTVNDLAVGSVKTVNDTAISSVKTFNDAS